MYFWRTVLLESSFKSFSIASFSSASGLSIVFSWANRGGGGGVGVKLSDIFD